MQYGMTTLEHIEPKNLTWRSTKSCADFAQYSGYSIGYQYQTRRKLGQKGVCPPPGIQEDSRYCRVEFMSNAIIACAPCKVPRLHYKTEATLPAKKSYLKLNTCRNNWLYQSASTLVPIVAQVIKTVRFRISARENVTRFHLH